MFNVNHAGIIASSQTASAGGEFLPTDVTSATLVEWHDPADASTITESSGLVSQWDDKSSNGNDALQSEGTRQPITDAVTIGGVNVFDFDGKSIGHGAISVGSSYTLVFVISVGVFDGANVPIGFGSGSQIKMASTTDITIDGSSNTMSPALSLNTPYIVVCQSDNVDTMVFVNGSAFTGSNTASVGAFNIGGIGARTVAFAGLDNHIGDVSMYSGIISDSELNQLGNSLGTKYSITWSDI